jgi:beta-lactamase regulating signal transducer with metallopeptidase domain
MNLSPNLLDALVRDLFSGLCNGAWRTTIVACVAVAGAACLPKRNRTLRHALWLTALAMMVCIMAAPTLMGRMAGRVLPSPAVRLMQMDLIPLNAESLPAAVDGAAFGRYIGAALDGSIRWIPWVLTGLWSIGAVIMAGRFITSRAGLFLLREKARPVRRAGILDMVRDLSGQVGVRRETVVLSSRSVRGPVVVGVTHPAVVLPEHIAEKYPLDMLEPLIIHELAHIRQRDHLFHAFQHLAGIALFFHPLYWLICRRLDAERERSCDDFVVRITGSPRRYALCLSEMAEHLTGHRFSSTRNRPLTDTEQRVEDLVSNKSVSPRPSTAALTALAVGAMLVTLFVSASRVIYYPDRPGAADGQEVAAVLNVPLDVRDGGLAIPTAARTGNRASFRLGNVGRWQMDSQVAPTFGAAKGVNRREDTSTGGAD